MRRGSRLGGAQEPGADKPAETLCSAKPMNQRRGWEDEATSRAVNAEPWQPPPGMVKRQCSDCHYFFAAPLDAAERRRPVGGKCLDLPSYNCSVSVILACRCF